MGEGSRGAEPQPIGSGTGPRSIKAGLGWEHLGNGWLTWHVGTAPRLSQTSHSRQWLHFSCQFRAGGEACMGSNKAKKESSALKIDTGPGSPGVAKRGLWLSP